MRASVLLALGLVVSLAPFLGCGARNDKPAAAPPSAGSTSASGSASASTAPSTSAAGPVDWPKDPAQIALGKELFAKNCAACHRADAGGLIGPNLTDAVWLHGKGGERVRVSIRDGHPTKGMPAWGALLPPDQIEALVAFVGSVADTNVPNGKAPQGTP